MFLPLMYKAQTNNNIQNTNDRALSTRKGPLAKLYITVKRLLGKCMV